MKDSKMSTVKLNWDTASAQMLTSLKEIWADEGFANVTLAFEDESVIHTNTTLLAAISPVMRSFLKDVKTPNSKMLMFGMESSMVRALLDFVFLEEICMEQEKLDSFFSTASKLKVNGFMEGTSDNKQYCDNRAENDLLNIEKKEQTDLGDFEMNLTQNTSQRKIISLELDEEIVTEKKGITCYLCKAAGKLDHDRFPTIDDLNEHDREVHMTEHSPTYNCEQCGLEFHKRIAFNQHKRKEHPENPTNDGVSCDVCGRKFKKKTSMDKHREYSHPVPGKMFKCRMPNCQKECTTKNASNVHYYQAHTEKQRREFEGKL